MSPANHDKNMSSTIMWDIITLASHRVLSLFTFPICGLQPMIS